MSIYLRNGVWQIYIVHNGKRVRRSACTKDEKQAQELHDKLKHELWRVEKIGDKPNRLWDEACIRWIHEKAHKKSLDDDKSKIKLLTQFRGKTLNELNRNFVMNVIESLRCKKSTKNRYIALIRAILKMCAGEWEWLDKAPSLKNYSEPKIRVRWLTVEEAQRLLDVLPDVISDMAKFSLMTGLRQGNVFDLEWSQVDLKNKSAWLHPDQTKSGRPLGVALNEAALDVLQNQIGRHSKYVFVRYGKKIKGIDSALWAKALLKADITNFKWHDLRHTWASWLVQSGVPLYDLKEMGGWETLEMVQRYAHLAPGHLQKHAVHADKFSATNTPHKENTLRLLAKVS